MISTEKAFSPFLSGGGEMGERIRNFDWSKTVLGAPDTWPQSLRSALSICLNSNFPIAIYWGKELTLLYNDAWSPIPGSKHPWALGKPAKKVWPEIWNNIEPQFQKAFSGESGGSKDALLPMRRHGYVEECYFDFTFTPVYGEAGKVEGVFNAVIETTKTILNERQLKTLRDLSNFDTYPSNAEQLFSLIARALEKNNKDFPFGVIYKIDDVAKKASPVAFCGISTEQSVFPSIIDLANPQEGSLNFYKAYSTNQIVVSENNGRRKNLPMGGWDVEATQFIHIPIIGHSSKHCFAILSAALNPYRKFDEFYLQFTKLVSDQITSELNNLLIVEEERKKAEALEEIDRAKTIFFTNISHEFRTPLTLMLGTIEEAIKDPQTTQSNLNKLNVAQRNALRLLKLVNTLLDFSRIESGRQKANYILTDIVTLTKNLASNFRSVIEKAGLNFIIHTQNITGAVYVDKQMWEKIVFNLLSNAFKYTLNGSITLSLYPQNKSVILKVEDTGVGIPENELPKMFERFHRIENVVGRTYEGTGIGLSLINELVQMHAGTITVESKKGEGSVFTVAIPFGKDHLPGSQTHDYDVGVEDILPDAYLEEVNILVSDNKSTETIPNNSEKSISVLIVDDNIDMLDYIQSLLKNYYNVITAINGKEALQKIKANKPLLVLSDIMMPVMNGIELLKEIKSNFETAHIPVILLTARAGEESKIEGYDIGADDYLTKPFSAKELLARIRSQIKIAQTKKHLQSQLRNFFMEAPVSIGVVRGPNHVWEIVNKNMLELSGRERAEDLLGKPIFESIPEGAGQGYEEVFDQVYTSGKRIVFEETSVQLIRKAKKETIYLKAIYEPLHNEDGDINGVMFLAYDITENVESRKKIEKSEKELQQLFKEAPVTIVVYSGENFVVKVANSLALEMWCKTEEEVLNKPFFDISPELKESQKPLLDKIIKTGESFIGKEFPVTYSKHGTQYSGYFDFVYQPVLNNAGIIEGIIAIGTEVTHSVIARKQIEESETRFRSMANEAPIFVWLTDENLQTTFLNKTGLMYFGLSEEVEFKKLSWKTFIHPEDIDRVLLIMNEAKHNQKPYSLEMRLRNEKNGEYRWFLDKGVPRYENNIFTGFVGTSLDIHDQKIKEQAKDEFISIAGHELKTPLTSAKAYLQIALDALQENKPNSLQYVDKANRSLDKLNALISELLDISRIQNGRLQLNTTTFNFNELIASVLESVQPTSRHSILKTGNADILVNGDKERLQQVLINLLNNAIKYSPGSDKILLHTEVVGNRIQVSVKDFGIGIAKNNLEKVFQRFYRVDETGKEFHGLGIGLYVAYDIIQRHNGNLWAESELGKGSTFYFELPTT